MDTEKIKKIIDKVRKMYKYDKRLKQILAVPAHIKLVEEKGEIYLSSIQFSYYGDGVYVFNGQIRYSPEYGPDEVLIKYSSLDELLEL